MDLQRLILFVALSFVMLLMWQNWQKDYGPQPPAPVATAPGAAPEVPGAVPSAKEQPPAAPGGASTPAQTQAQGQLIDVYTDTFHLVLDTAGGTIRRTELIQYPVAVDQPQQPFVLLEDTPPDLFIAQSGLQSADGPAPDHTATFTAAQREYRLAPGQQQLEVPLTWSGGNGIVVTKTFILRAGDYTVDVAYDVKNEGTVAWTGVMYRQLQRTKTDKQSSRFVYTYTGAVYSTPEQRYRKYDYDEMEKANLNVEAKSAWVAMIQHYFVAAWIPPLDQDSNIYSRALDKTRFIIGAQQRAPTQAAPGQTAHFQSRLYMGPKLQEALEQIAPALDKTVDYGSLHLIAKPIYWLLEKIHDFVRNWGWSIIILTIIIKGLFYKLSETSYRSMAHMRKMQPRLKAVQERYADDKQKMQEAMMKLYREEKINPLGGCLPILVQIPVFIALYWVLLESVEMRQAPWILWIHDLSAPDPFFVLPIIMGVTMIAQQRLNPSPMDPVQAKVMMLMPVMFTIFFLWFPAGLVLYWVVSNFLSIVQQWYITKYVVKA